MFSGQLFAILAMFFLIPQLGSGTSDGEDGGGQVFFFFLVKNCIKLCFGHVKTIYLVIYKIYKHLINRLPCVALLVNQMLLC